MDALLDTATTGETHNKGLLWFEERRNFVNFLVLKPDNQNLLRAIQLKADFWVLRSTSIYIQQLKVTASLDKVRCSTVRIIHTVRTYLRMYYVRLYTATASRKNAVYGSFSYYCTLVPGLSIHRVMYYVVLTFSRVQTPDSAIIRVDPRF